MNRNQFIYKIILLIGFILVCVPNVLILSAQQSVANKNAISAKYALLIGIDDYRGSPFKSLLGAKNDISLIKTVLITRFELKTPTLPL